MDEALLHRVLEKYDKIITLEEAIVKGGFGSAVLEFTQENKYFDKKITVLGIPDQFIEHGSVEELFQQIGLDEAGILNTIRESVTRQTPIKNRDS